MKIKNNLQYIWLLFAAAMVGIDRLTKWLVVSNMELENTIHIIKVGDTEVLNIYYCLNNGAAFSKLSGQTVPLIVITSIVILGLLFLMVTKRVKRPVYMAAVSLIIGGGIGNLIDRIFNDGLVIDFIDFRLINLAIFNFADICAVCGAGLLMVMVIVDEVQDKKKKKQASETVEGNDGKS